MNILNLLKEDNYKVVYVSSTNGDEYAGPCPYCGGNDRFRVWPKLDGTGKYWCRKCKKSGGTIKFLMEKRGFTYSDACEFLGVSRVHGSHATSEPHAWLPEKITAIPNGAWQGKGKQIVEKAQKILLETNQGEECLNWLQQRGLSKQTIMNQQLGFNPKDMFMSRQEWGLPIKFNQKTNKPAKVWVPRGLLIPYFKGDDLARMRIRRDNITDGGDRYIIVPGSSTIPMVSDKTKQAIIIVESELDGMLIDQEAGDLISTIALGSVTIKPDMEIDRILKQSKRMLCALDYDEAGWGNLDFWKTTYHAIPWPPALGKDPTEMLQTGINIREWIVAGIGDGIETMDGPADNASPRVTCFGDECDYVGYETIDGVEYLYCYRKKVPLIDLDSCPLNV